jgi:hypothetical protein
MNGDWYGSSITTHEPPSEPRIAAPHVFGYGVWATGKGKAPWLCKDLGQLWPTAEAAYEWLDSLIPVPGGPWTYTVVEMREVEQ